MKKLSIYLFIILIISSIVKLTMVISVKNAYAEPNIATVDDKINLIQESIALFEKNDCKSCHKIETKLTGPAYQDVANKYFPQIKDGVITTLSEKVIKGGNRNWGFAMMTGHPNLSPDDAQKMVTSVLLLADPDVPQEKILKLPN